MLEWLSNLHSAEGITELVKTAGILAPFLLFGIIFAETGILAGFFLPGDSLLITAGVLANTANPNHIATLPSVLMLNLILVIAAVTGDQLGFYLGSKVGHRIWERPDGRFYKGKHLVEAKAFYDKWGGVAIVGARYVPILRTFVPFAAGISNMQYSKFVFWNILGGVLWITSLLWIGYYLGGTTLAKSLDRIIVIVVLVSVLPLAFGLAKRWYLSRNAGSEA